MKRLKCIVGLGIGAASLFGADAELTNYKSGIDVTWGGVKGTDYGEEYFYSDKLVDDHKVVYLRSATPIAMAHNERNVVYRVVNRTSRMALIGVDGPDHQPNTGDEGIIRYKLDRDRQYYWKWADRSNHPELLLPAFDQPFTLDSQKYADSGKPVVGTTGPTDAAVTAKATYYYRGIVDSFGDEWHLLSYADDDKVVLSTDKTQEVKTDWCASDGKTVLLVVNPKTPCLTARVTGTGQFYTTPPKAYWTPKIIPQTTYFSAGASGTVTFELRDLYGNHVHYRINGGEWIDAGDSHVVLGDAKFAQGNNTLDYFYAGQEAHVKTRVLVKDPAYPSAAEPHGNYLWVDAEGYKTVLERLKREPYRKVYSAFKERREITGQSSWDQNAHRGLRYEGVAGSLHGSSQALCNAFVALTNGWKYSLPGSSKSSGEYAKEMLLESTRTIDPLGWEMMHTSDAIPSREINYRGYYDSDPVQDCAFAYDLMIANFKATQVKGGITAVEDYFIRDHLANFVYDAMLWSGGMSSLGHPLMWGGARMMASTSVAMIMKEYSTPYYGTSGFGTVQTTYPLCPYQDDRLTWKQALFDGNVPRKSYPNYTYGVGFSDNGKGDCVLLTEGEKLGGHTYPLGTWRDRANYFSQGLMGMHVAIWANMARLWGGNRSDPRLEIAITNASQSKFIGAVDHYPQTPKFIATPLLLNSRWPELAAFEAPFLKSRPPKDFNATEKLLREAGVFGFAWYDDTYERATTAAKP